MPTKVLSIVGPGRSGSTILASILGEVPGVASAGEVRWLWRRGVLDERPCGCGEPPTRCPVWSRVLDQVAPGLRRQDDARSALQEVLDAQREVTARRHRLRVLNSASRATVDWPALGLLRTRTADAYEALASATGAQLVVDSSKRAQEAAVVAGADAVDHYVLHLVRDPRAVAYSWGRVKPSTSSPGARPMAVRGPVASAVRWSENTVGAELLRPRIDPDRWMSLRYEDFTRDPAATVARILGFVGVEGDAPFLDRDTVVLGPNHIVAGNPSRFRTGTVKIREDDEWQASMPARRRRLVEAVALPLLRRYGYPLRVGRPIRSA